MKAATMCEFTRQEFIGGQWAAVNWVFARSIQSRSSMKNYHHYELS
ncbi:hypothetical protein ACP4OV_026748 [Aristida adscensionis]